MGLHQDAIHLAELAPNQGAAGPGNMADVVQPQVVQDQHVPVPSLQHPIQVPCDVVIHLQGQGRVNGAPDLPGLHSPGKRYGRYTLQGFLLSHRTHGSLKTKKKTETVRKN